MRKDDIRRIVKQSMGGSKLEEYEIEDIVHRLWAQLMDEADDKGCD